MEEEKKFSGGENENMRMFAFGFAGLLVVVLLLSAVVGTYRVYAKGAGDGFSVAVARMLNLPVMKVNGERVLYSTYVDYLRALRNSADYERSQGGQALSDEQLSDRVLWWQVDNILTNQAAKKFGVTVEKDDLEKLRGTIVEQFQTVEAANQELQKRYGWDLEDYERMIMRNIVLQQKLAEKISLDQSAREEVRKQAQSVLDEIKNGAKFEDMAAKYGEDGTAQQGGSLGWFGKGDMVPEFENAAFSLKKGELAQTLVETEFGYHIVKVDDKRTTKTKDNNGKTVNAEEVNASHILFRFPSADKYLEEMSKQADIKLYASLHNPFANR